MRDERDFFGELIGDGRPLLLLMAMCLVMAGLFALFLALTVQFLPHDVQFLGMAPSELCAINECRIVHFMVHDRVSFGGVLVAIGTLYLWLAAIPLRDRQPWAWWLFLVSGMLGFATFLAYLGYGYLDTWHGVATLGLLPLFVAGLARSFFELPFPRWNPDAINLWPPSKWPADLTLGKCCLLATALGLVGAGATILTVGITTVFVPQDLAYMGLNADDLRAINPRLVPLIAHDRAGFGGAVLTYGVLLGVCVWNGGAARSLWQAVCLSGCVAFIPAIGIHPKIGYTDALHLAPAVAGACLFVAGLLLTLVRPNAAVLPDLPR